MKPHHGPAASAAVSPIADADATGLPLLRTWRAAYAFVLGTFVLWLLLLWVLMRRFA